MTSTVRTLLYMILGPTLVLSLWSSAIADEAQVRWSDPVLSGYGYINPLPDTLFQPDPAKQYRVAFDVADDSTHVNKGLWHVARVINLFGKDGKPASNLDLAVIIHGPATRAVLNDQAYRARFGKKNPNAELLEKLGKHGVRIYVCGQAIADNGYYYQNVRPDVEVVLGALAAEINLAADGYTLIKL